MTPESLPLMPLPPPPTPSHPKQPGGETFVELLVPVVRAKQNPNNQQTRSCALEHYPLIFKPMNYLLKNLEGVFTS